MVRSLVRRLFDGAGPSSILGRWCGPWYSKSCDQMRKGALADHDNSACTAPPARKETRTQEEVERDAVNVFAHWHK